MYFLELRCLGGFAAMYCRTSLAFRTDKVRALLAYLALHANTPQSRAVLVSLFYPEYPESQARKNFNLCLTRLRESLEPVQATPGSQAPLLTSDRQTVQLHWDAAAFRVDALEFDDLLQQCRLHPHERLERCTQCLQRLRRAADLYQGDFLAGLYLADSQPFNEWRLWQQETRLQQVLSVLATLTDHALAVGNYEEAQLYARRQLALLPRQEAAQRQLTAALVAMGQRAAAPARGTAAILGREALLSEMSAMLLDPVNRLITLTGPGGVGKTSLARALVHRLNNQFPQGAWFVSLASLTGAEPAVLAQTIAATLKLSLPTQGDATAALLAYLRPRALLLVLDNFEPLPDGAAFVLTLLEAAPHLTVLVTSRQRLGFQREVVRRLGDLPGVGDPGSQRLVARHPDSTPGGRIGPGL